MISVGGTPCRVDSEITDGVKRQLKIFFAGKVSIAIKELMEDILAYSSAWLRRPRLVFADFKLSMRDGRRTKGIAVKRRGEQSF